VDDICKSDPYFYPGHWIAQRCVSLELLENVVDLEIKLKTWGSDSNSKVLPSQLSAFSREARRSPPVAARSLLSTSQ